VPISVVGQDARGGTPDADDALEFAEELELSFPVLADAEGEFWPVWNPDSVLPMATILDADGVVIWSEAGGSSGIEEMAEIVVSLLAAE